MQIIKIRFVDETKGAEAEVEKNVRRAEIEKNVRGTEVEKYVRGTEVEKLVIEAEINLAVKVQIEGITMDVETGIQA